jgi:hypothetical protein
MIKMPPEKMAGAMRGRVMPKRVRPFDAPRTTEASSILGSILSRAAEVEKKTKG